MAEEKEVLKIEAELDTSKLKQQAQQGMQSVVNEEKKVENQSKQTAKAIDEIGQSGKNVGHSLQQAGNQGSDALRQVGQEADKTAKKIADIEKSVKDLKLGQAFGLMSRFANSEIGQHFGNAVGDSLGMSDSDKGIAGGAVQGFLGGAAAGAMIGPWGAVIGGLGGAAAALLKAGLELQDANKTEEEKARLNEANADKLWSTVRGKEEFNNLISGGTDEQLQERLEYERRQKTQLEQGIKTFQDKLIKGVGEYGTPLTANERNRLANGITESVGKRGQAMDNIAILEAELARRDREADARVAKFLADEEAAKNSFMGPQMPPEIAAQREAERQLQQAREDEANRRQRAFDSYTIEQKRENISNIQDTQLKPLESMMNGMASFKLTDSLTRIGGGSGYGVQMQGISKYVSNISSNIQTIKGIIQQELDAIRELSNKYKPYYGEFMSQTDN